MDASLPKARPRVGIGRGEPDEERLRAYLEPHFELAPGEAADCALRLIGPHELVSEGAGALRRVRQQAPALPIVVILPPNGTPALVRECHREGASDVVLHDELEWELPCAAERALERRPDAEAQRIIAALTTRAHELEQALASARDAYDQTLVALASALDFREKESGFHSRRVALFSIFMGLRLGLDETALENLFRGALLHDVGNIATPDSILLKEGPLDPGEWELMRQHAEMGAAIVTGISFLRDAGDVPMAHHEAWDGRGYPRGLREHEIPLCARIFAVVDSYDAIRSDRPFKCGQSYEVAIERLHRAAGERLDPAIVEIFCAEPETTWSTLEKCVGGSLGFDSALRACKEVDSL